MESKIQEAIVKAISRETKEYQVFDGDVAFRHFGTWYTPEGEDDEDYDWEVPTVETLTAVDLICENMKSEFPGWNFRYMVEEKNRISIRYELKD